MLEVKRAAVAEVQRAVAVAVAESRASERLRVHRLLDLPMSQRNHSSLRQSSFLRVHGSSSAVEARTTPTTTSNSAPSTTEDEKDIHLTSVMGSVSAIDRSLFEETLKTTRRILISSSSRAVGIAADPLWRPAAAAESHDTAAPSASIATGKPVITRPATICRRANRADRPRVVRRESRPIRAISPRA